MQSATVSFYDITTGIVAYKTMISASHISAADLQSPMLGLVGISADSEPGRSYVKNNQVIALPTRPDQHHVWDLTSESWIDPREPEEIEADMAAAEIERRASVVVSRFQARAALLQAGLLDAVNTAVAAADPITQLAWADAQEFRRTSPTIAALAAALGLTDGQVDDLFEAAAEIET